MSDVAGRELDLTIAVEIMGYVWTGNPRGNQELHAPDGTLAVKKERSRVSYIGYPDGGNLPFFSTSITAAWDVWSFRTSRYCSVSDLPCGIGGTQGGERGDGVSNDEKYALLQLAAKLESDCLPHERPARDREIADQIRIVSGEPKKVIDRCSMCERPY